MNKKTTLKKSIDPKTISWRSLILLGISRKIGCSEFYQTLYQKLICLEKIILLKEKETDLLWNMIERKLKINPKQVQKPNHLMLRYVVKTFLNEASPDTLNKLHDNLLDCTCKDW